MSVERFVLPIRIIVEDPVPGVAVAVQKGKSGRDGLIRPTSGKSDALRFEFDLLADGVLASGGARLLGPFVQGSPEKRFVYLCVGRLAGQEHSRWSRRIKVPLTGITAELAASGRGARLEARIAGRGKHGSPACASVPLLSPGWSLSG